MCLWLIHAQTLHEPAVLLGSQTFGLTLVPWPLEYAGLQPLIQQEESVALPVKRLDPVTPSSTEQKQSIGERIQLKLLLNEGSQSVDTEAKIRIAAGNVHPVGSGEICQHDFSTRKTVSTVAASAPEWMSASAPAIRIVTEILL